MKQYFRWLTPTRSNTSEANKDNERPTEQKSTSYLGSSLSGLFGVAPALSASWTSSDYSALARSGFMRNPIVYRCVRLISEAAANVPLIVHDQGREHDDHPMNRLFLRPNGRCSGKDFMENVLGHLMVSGNAYVELITLDGEPRELHALRPDRMRVLPDKTGWAPVYEYVQGSSKKIYREDEEGNRPILHLTLFHPLDDQYGFPPLQAALMALDIHNSSSQWNKSLLDNSARPSGALVYAPSSDGNLTDEQFNRLKSELEDGYSGATRAGRPMLLEGGLDWKAMGYSPKDMDFIEGRNAAARDIALAFGVPPMLLGIPGDNTYSNYQEANRAFARQTVLPLINRILDGFNHWLGPRFDGNAKLRIEEDRVEGLVHERAATWKRLNEATFLSESEKRQAVGYSAERPAE